MLGETVLTRTFPGFGSDQYDQTLQILGLCPEREVPVIRDLGARRQILFYLSRRRTPRGRVRIREPGSVARGIRFTEIMISRKLSPRAEALADPAINMKALLG
ncbi:oxidoreductase C-terminal domain-containing protein [Bradyrhizobium sp. WSM1417]|uniref:oxidoreductase C-terminal domain-containing protein n=1 Tax=Bradyrhizobium sp. WSM1417 TaxID=754500 RepID=UPI000A02D225